ncbi:hypothetical protein GCU56_02450 [Geodermatophilus sabuli]|uniref:Uncharacterized protein n=1 Tax=Geodermatophilus sabuli TaxID=1564158 RepID=A0A7K3VYM6_9ACTN|nr:hypothetical protein [Geodermatophilus sabuli]NEK56737.1 hypothetical protein [Geodermatophilus sabuli]
MSRYYVNKFLFQADRSPELLAAYKADPVAALARWEEDHGRWLDKNATVERTTWLAFTDEERRALEEHDHVALFELGAHWFPTLQVFVGMHEKDYEATSGPLSYQREFAADLAHWRGRTYPDIRP